MFIILDIWRNYVGEAPTYEIAVVFAKRWADELPKDGPYSIFKCEFVDAFAKHD